MTLFSSGGLAALLLLITHFSGHAAWARTLQFGSKDPAVVATTSGPIRGVVADDHRAFLGIPFAAPPVGKLRWAPPRPPTSWKEVRKADAFANKCPALTWAAPKSEIGSEDCLYLNVYTPPASKGAQLPVMVWFHGGGFVAGSAQDVDAHVFASKANAIVVTANYRLGVFGVFASPALDAESPEKVSGNQWIRDQQAALHWVQDNIQAFGGDPGRVTISGQSAGAIGNWVHLVAPSSQGLFNQVIAESGPYLMRIPRAGNKTIQDEEQGGTSSRLFAALSCDKETDPLACARSKNTHDVLYAIDPLNARAAGWSVVVDGVLLVEPVMALMDRGARKKVPILTGFNQHEGGFQILMRLANGGKVLTEEQYVSERSASPGGDRVITQYPVADYSSADDASVAAGGDSSACTSLDVMKLASASGPVYLYEFADPNPPSTIFALDLPPTIHPGAYHTAEIAYVFQTGFPADIRPGPAAFQGAQKLLSDRMLGYWASFIWTGKPTSDDSWPSLSSSSTVLMLRPEGDEAVPQAQYDQLHRCDFWRSLGGG